MNMSIYEILSDNRNARIESFKSLSMLNLWTKNSPKEKQITSDEKDENNEK